MTFRYKFSIVLIVLGFISAIMSFSGKNPSSTSPGEILASLTKGDFRLTADELAQMMVNESAFQIIDVRDSVKYKVRSLPGAVSVPLANLLETRYEHIFSVDTLKTVFYADDELLSSQAWILATQNGYKNLHILKGGLAEWDSIVMNSKFEGQTITAQENALFEKRYKARRLFTQWNAMPDSLKITFFAVKQKKDKELVGGCE